MKKTTKKNRFNLYDWLYKRNLKKDADDDKDHPRTFLFFFKLLWRNLGRLMTVNLYFTFGNLALFLLLLILSGYIGPHSGAPSSDMYAPLYGASLFAKGSPVLNSLIAVHGTMSEISVMTPLMIVLTVIAVILLAATYGPVMTGLAINLRSLVRGEPLFMWSDFWRAIRTNLRQSIILGILDLGILALLAYGAVFYYMNMGLTMITNVFFLFTLVLIVLYLFMRKYLYLMLVTFELSIPKLFKNALIFSVLGLGRNLISTVGCAILVVLNAALFAVYMPVGIILPFVITVGVCLFVDAYAAWPKIQKHMIDPYVGTEDENDGEEEAESVAE